MNFGENLEKFTFIGTPRARITATHTNICVIDSRICYFTISRTICMTRAESLVGVYFTIPFQYRMVEKLPNICNFINGKTNNFKKRLINWSKTVVGLIYLSPPSNRIDCLMICLILINDNKPLKRCMKLDHEYVAELCYFVYCLDHLVP